VPNNAHKFQHDAPECEASTPQAAERSKHVYAIMSSIVKLCSIESFGRCQKWERDDTQKCGERSFSGFSRRYSNRILVS